MRRFKKILVVAGAEGDASAALARAVALASADGARIKVYDVLDPLPRSAKKLFKVIARPKLERMLVDKRREELEAIVAGVELHGVQVEVQVGMGLRFVEIIREVLRNDHDLVMKPAVTGTRGRTSRFGSTDLHLMRECPCAVWILKPPRSGKSPRVLAAVDPDPTDPDSSRLSDSVMELAISLSKLEKSDLHVVHAWILYNEKVLNVLVGNLDKLIRNTRKNHRRWLNALLERFSLPRDRRRVHLVQGPAKEAIPQLARKKRVSLIVMGTAARSGVPHFLIGNTAEDVLNEVDCSVVTVKAEGFVSPVTLPEQEVSDAQAGSAAAS